MSIKINPTNTTAKPAPTKPKRRRKPSSVPTCEQCGDELAVRWRRRWWCIRCDEAELFSDVQKMNSDHTFNVHTSLQKTTPDPQECDGSSAVSACRDIPKGTVENSNTLYLCATSPTKTAILAQYQGLNG